MSLFNLRFVPFGVQGISGCKRVKVCHIGDARRMRIMMPSDQKIKVRFISGGRMYAGMVRRGSSSEPRFARTARPINFGVRAPARQAEVPVQASKDLSFRNLLSSLTANEMANRAAALRAAHASR